MGCICSKKVKGPSRLLFDNPYKQQDVEDEEQKDQDKYV